MGKIINKKLTEKTFEAQNFDQDSMWHQINNEDINIVIINQHYQSIKLGSQQENK